MPALARHRTRALVTAAAAAFAMVAALLAALPPAHAAAGPLKPLKLAGVCNSASWALASAIDAKLTADKSPLRMIQSDQPKKGETGYNDGTVADAYIRLTDALGKNLGELTAADVTAPANAAKVAQAISDALDDRTNAPGGTLTLSYSDFAGNTVYLWCLKANADHGGPDLALLYVPTGKTPADGVWIAGCVLAGGMNEYSFSVDTATRVFAKIVWYNIGPDPNNARGYIRYTYTYDATKNILNIVKETGKLNLGAFVPATTEAEKTPAAPPAQFKDLKLNGNQISLLDGADGGIPARTVVVAAADPVTPTALDLTNPPLAGSGTATDPFVGIDPTFQPGDSIAVTMPDGTLAVATGTNTDWTLLNPGESTVLLQYNGTSPLDLAIGDSVSDVAELSAAPPNPSASPSPGNPIPSPTPSPSNPTGTAACHIVYTTTAEWAGGFAASVTIVNTGTTPMNGWTVAFAYPGDQLVTGSWSTGSTTQNGPQITATNAPFNAAVAPGASTTFGLQGTWTVSDAPPVSFTLNDAPCA
jgi:hypothetical protein